MTQYPVDITTNPIDLILELGPADDPESQTPNHHGFEAPNITTDTCAARQWMCSLSGQ